MVRAGEKKFALAITGSSWAKRRYVVGLQRETGADIQVSPNSACPEGTCVKTLYITEGASDTAAALSLGISAIGRSSCISGTPLIKELLARLRPSSLAIVADNDAPGLAGARALSQELGAARILTPPEGCKDLREWCKSQNVPWNIARGSKVPHGEYSHYRLSGRVVECMAFDTIVDKNMSTNY